MQAVFGCCILILYLYILVVFFLGALAHLLMCTHANRHILQIALCGGGGGCGCNFM